MLQKLLAKASLAFNLHGFSFCCCPAKSQLPSVVSQNVQTLQHVAQSLLDSATKMVVTSFVLVLGLLAAATAHTVPLAKVQVTDYGAHGIIPHRRTEVKKSAPARGHNVHRRSFGSELNLAPSSNPLMANENSGELDDLMNSESAYGGYRHSFGSFHSFLPYPPTNHGPHPGAYPPRFGQQQHQFPGQFNNDWGERGSWEPPCNGYGCGKGPNNGNGYGHGRGNGNGHGHGNGYGPGHGNGHGQGHGNGFGYGQGHGNGQGHGHGHGHGNGNPYPPPDHVHGNNCHEHEPENEHGHGHGNGHGHGHGHGHGYGHGHGHGHGNNHGFGDDDDDDDNCDFDNSSEEMNYSTEPMPIILPTTQKLTHPPIVPTMPPVTHPPIVPTTAQVTHPPIVPTKPQVTHPTPVLTTEKIQSMPTPASTENPVYDIDVRLGEAGRR